MALFHKQQKGGANNQEIAGLNRAKQEIKLSLFEQLTSKFDSRVSSELESMVLMGQVVNYLMADGIGGDPKDTPPETIKIIEKIKDQVPYIAHNVMQLEPTKTVIVGFLQMQGQIYSDAIGSDKFLSTSQGLATTRLLSTYNPTREPVDPTRFKSSLQEIGVQSV